MQAVAQVLCLYKIPVCYCRSHHQIHRALSIQIYEKGHRQLVSKEGKEEDFFPGETDRSARRNSQKWEKTRACLEKNGNYCYFAKFRFVLYLSANIFFHRFDDGFHWFPKLSNAHSVLITAANKPFLKNNSTFEPALVCLLPRSIH